MEDRKSSKKASATTLYDLVIRNATIVDGTGKPAYAGDLAVSKGKIAAVGKVSGAGAREIDAGGKLLTPGWVDVHSHMDGQATWDPLCSPAANHGITTLIMGNCGIGFAPCEPNKEAQARLITVVEDVEDIPGAALHEGVKWEWESFPEYLDAVERFPRAIDVGAQVPHCAVRTYVMGERGANNELATPEDIEADGSHRQGRYRARRHRLYHLAHRTAHHRRRSCHARHLCR